MNKSPPLSNEASETPNLLQSRATVARNAHNVEVGGSIPSSAPNLCRHRLTVRTAPFHGDNRGSIPRGGTI